MSDHSHYGEYADARHDHERDYAASRHDHDVDYAEKHHRHYDLEREGERLKALTDLMVKDLRELREDLRKAFERIRQLEDRQQGPDDKPEDESWRSTLADYQVASGAAEYDDEDDEVGPEDAALLDAVAGALGYQAVTLDDAVGTWTGHGPGCGCPDCEGMRSDAGSQP